MAGASCQCGPAAPGRGWCRLGPAVGVTVAGPRADAAAAAAGALRAHHRSWPGDSEGALEGPCCAALATPLRFRLLSSGRGFRVATRGRPSPAAANPHLAS